MAESVHLLGYHCEFINTLHDNFYCKKCTLVARRLTYTSCCGESYCHACIADIQQQDKPCPGCEYQNFSTMKPLKHQRQMDCLKVKCRGRGCDWLGMLDQLDAHLDPDQDNCQHVDIKCPLNCLQTIPKNKLEQHVSMECVKRDSVCQHCQQKLLEQEEKLQVQEEKLQEQEEKLQEQGEQIQKVRALLQEYEKKFGRLEEKSVQNEGAVDKVTNFILKREFTMENFTVEREKDKLGDWKSPAMYTHVSGYKFCIGIDANGRNTARGEAMSVSLYAMQGDYDHLLKWPACVSFTLELLHRQGGQNIIGTLTEAEWLQPTRPFKRIRSFLNVERGQTVFLEHSKLADFLDNDALYFHLSNITV